MRFRDSNAPVVGMGFLRERQRLLVGTRVGFVRLWEPRMFEEPISEFNVAKKGARQSSLSAAANDASNILQQMDVQKNGQLVACAMADSTIHLFDIDGREGALSKVRYPTASGTASSYFYSPSSAIVGGLSSLLLKHARRRSSSGGSSLDGRASPSLAVNSTTTATSSSAQQNQPTLAAPTAMRFHQYRVLLGVASGDSQFRAFAMPNVDTK